MAKNQYEELTDKQKRFAENYLEVSNGTRAALAAGYSESGAATESSRLLKNDKVRAYIDELQAERRETIQNTLKKQAVEAVEILLELARSAESENVKMQAVKDILDRAGYKPTEKSENKNEMSGKIEFGFVDPNEE